MLVEVWRSGFLESVHRGSLVVLDADGGVTFGTGAIDRPILPRSSNKPVQATALLAAGWRPRSGEELAIAAGSHNGEDGHRDLAAAMLTAAELGPDDLGCPVALPQHEPTRAAWITANRAPARLAMNCSGKHAGMLSACVAAGWPTEGYLLREHPLQQAIESRLGDAAGEPVTAVVVDDAMRAHPWFVAGTDREDTDLMRAVPGLLMKGGADGVHAAALPGRGAVALKLDDGGDRGRLPALLAGLQRLGAPLGGADRWLQTPVLGGADVVGDVRPSAALTR